MAPGASAWRMQRWCGASVVEVQEAALLAAGLLSRCSASSARAHARARACASGRLVLHKKPSHQIRAAQQVIFLLLLLHPLQDPCREFSSRY